MARPRGGSRFALAALLVVAGAAASSCDSPLFGCKQEGLDPSVAVPDSFIVRFTTSRGPFDVIARKGWAPIGVSRFYGLVQGHYFDENRFFRVIHGFAAQFGISGDPKVTAQWRRRCVADDSVKHQNERGTLSFARRTRPGTRSTQMFFNLVDNTPLDSLYGGFAPIGQVTSPAGMAVVDSLYSGYGDSMSPKGVTQFGHEGPLQDSILQQGNPYLARGWPKLDYIQTARVVQVWPAQ